jgi:uncharacterized protein YdhG (YjbR/CyaY superfamily)
MKSNPEVTAYILSAPSGQQPLLKQIRALIRKALPQAEEAFESKMPIYKIGGQWTVGFASRKSSPMFYCMKTQVLDSLDSELGAFRTGKSCVAIKPSLKDPALIISRILAAISAS